MRILLRTSFEIARLLLAIAFGFFGYMKATLSLQELAEHGAWVASLGLSATRIVGVYEMLCAVAVSPLVAWRHILIVRSAAALLLLNQLVAVTMHLHNGQAEALTLNALWSLLACWTLSIHWALKPELMQKSAPAT